MSGRRGERNCVGGKKPFINVKLEGEKNLERIKLELGKEGV